MESPANSSQMNGWLARWLVAVMAAVSISNVVKSSLGPVGLDKMMVDDVGVNSAHIHSLATRIIWMHAPSS
jgi:hypothetical protein